MILSVVIPVHNGGEGLRHCLEALAASARPADEVIVVDDASTDASGELARQHGARVVDIHGSPRGPACARNRGAEIATGDVLVFVDADVAVHRDALGRMEQTLGEHPKIAALFGSYDDAPPARDLVSRYKNLLHHYVHQHGRREAVTFWAGCGAIRRDTFQAMGGFDEGYARPSIEDIELGSRLRRADLRVLLCPDVQATHLKRWTLSSLLRSDILDRALPWTRLILSEAHLPEDLNLDVRSRLSALAGWGIVLCPILAWWSSPTRVFWPYVWASAFLAWLIVVALNAKLYGFFLQRGGAWFALRATGLHLFYLLYSSLVFGVAAGWYTLTKRRGRA
jgi:glycosyltransferase involved in cell wall biosynthesis